MANLPEISVIIPCLNEEVFLPRLLKNLTIQTLKSFEVIVVDGHSEDKTRQKALEFKDKLKIKVKISSKRNASNQRNLGAKIANGKYLIFFDADTQIPVNFLKKIQTGFETTNASIINTFTAPDSNLDKDKIIATSINFLFEVTRLLKFPGIFGAMMAFKKDTFNQIGGFDETLRFGEDEEILKRGIKNGFSYEILKDVTYIYSLRRFRKDGTLKLIRQSAMLHLAYWMKNEKLTNLFDYQMGGHLFERESTKKLSNVSFKKFSSKLKKEFKIIFQ